MPPTSSRYSNLVNTNELDASMSQSSSPLPSSYTTQDFNCNSDPQSQPDHDTALLTLYASLSSQATRLLDELKSFQSRLALQSRQKDVFLARFGREIRREADVLDRYGVLIDKYRRQHQKDAQVEERSDHEAAKDGEVESEHEGTEDDEGRGDDGESDDAEIDNGMNTVELPGLHNIRSSNVMSYIAVWEEAKRNEGLTALKKKVKYSVSGGRGRSYGVDGNGGRIPRRNGRETVVVDVAAEYGGKWIKVWTKNHAWLEMDMAKEGLVDLDQDEDGNRVGDNSDGGKADIPHLTQHDLEVLQDLKLVKMATEFVAAALTTRVDHRHPRVHFVLPRIYRGRSRDVDIVLAVIEQMGIVVSCAGERDQHQEQAEASLTSCFERMLALPPSAAYPNPDLLNLDCTVLIALISDISHFRLRNEEDPDGVEIPAHYHGQSRCDIVDQFRSDRQRALLPRDVYPVLSRKRLRCTCVASNHLKKIVRLMGTETERQRAEILLGDLDAERARDKWNKLTTRPMDESLKLPIEIVEFDREQALAEIRRRSQVTEEGVDDVDYEVAQRIANLETRQMSNLNKAVFFHGWSSRITTFTLNRVVSGYIRRAIDEFLDDIEVQRRCDKKTGDLVFRGPRMEICARERSLIGSEKTCRNNK